MPSWLDWDGHPLAIGELRASTGADSAPTVLCYGHFDVQPPDPLELWETPPFEASVRDGQVFARGIADDKGQLFLLLEAASRLARAGELPVNVRFACDGEEETGGHSIVDYLAADERGADVCVIFDSGMVERDRPAFNIATRGLVLLPPHAPHRRARPALRACTAARRMNAVNALGARPRRPSCPATTAVCPSRCAKGSCRRATRSGRPGACCRQAPDELAGQGARPRDPGGGRGVLPAHLGRARRGRERHRGRLAAAAEDGAAGRGGRERLDPPRAGPGPEEIAPEFERLLREATPEGAELTVERWASSEPGLVDQASKAIQLGLDAFERVLGVRPLLIRSGGTLPIVPALAKKGIPTILTGFSLPDCNIHSPNERMEVEYLPKGIAAAEELFRAFGGL